MMKTCPDCNLEKPEAEYAYKNRTLVRCKACQNLQRVNKRKEYLANAENSMKVCKECKAEKKASEFEFGTLTCKACFSELRKEAVNRPTEMDPDKTCKTCQETKPATMFRKRAHICKECSKKKLYEWREKNKEQFLAICKTYRSKPEKKAIKNAYWRKRYADNIKDRLLQLYRNRVRQCIKTKYCPKFSKFDYVALLGCEWETLIAWLEFNMKHDMTWDNYGEHWHVDHVYPCALFNFEIETERKRCFNWSNLTPLEAVENMRKSDKLDIDLIQHYRRRALDFIKQTPTINIVTDELPDDLRLLVLASGALTTNVAAKAAAGSEEKSEVQ